MNSKIIFIILFAFCVIAERGQAFCLPKAEVKGRNPIVVTEICIANIDQVIDHSNNYGGWVELYNSGNTGVQLDGWYVSDDAEILAKHKLSGYGMLKPGCYQCVFFGHNAVDGEYGPNASKQVRFKLNRNGGALYLSSNGKDVDMSVIYPESLPRCSYARMRPDADDWQYCGMPTPGESNAGHYAQECLQPPLVDIDSRLFTTGFDVHVKIPSGTTLRYTMDGSTPTHSNGEISTNGVFPVSGTTVLRLRLFSDDKLPSAVVTRSYIYKDRDYYLPIVAVSTDPRNLYDDQIGCYVNGKNGIIGRGSKVKSNLNMDWERPVNFEYLTAEGKMVVNQEASFEVAGGYSRHFEPASFKVQAKKMYDGNGHFDYPLFAGKPYCKYKQLLVRNGGNNNRTDGGPRIKDAITQQVLTTIGFYVDAQEYQPVHLFINGKYIAMMNVREPNNRFHGCANYGFDDDEMDGFEYSGGSYHQKGGDREAFDKLISLSAEAVTDVGYAEVEKLLDMDEFVRYMATICYTGSYDWLLNGNNVKGYRTWRDGKFHFVFFDQDLTWERTNNVEVIEGVNTNEVLVLYNNLKRNKTFRQQFVAAYCILHSSVYTPERCKYVADSICDMVKGALSFDRRSTTQTYNKMQKEMWGEAFRQERIKSLVKAYELPECLIVNIGTNCKFARIRIGGMDVPFGRFSGEIFPAASVATEAPEGYRFIGWKDQDGSWVSNEKEFSITKKGMYTAVYSEIQEGISPLCINEVSAANKIFVNDYAKRADCIELYNRGREPIDVAQWFFSDDENAPTKYKIDVVSTVNTVIQPGRHLVIWCDAKPSLSEPHLPFKLDNADSSFLFLQSADGTWRDSICYNVHSANETVGRYPDGGCNIRLYYHPTIGGPNTATRYDKVASMPPLSALPSTQMDEVERINYYTIDGIRIPTPLNGICIKETIYKSGQKQCSKIFVGENDTL